MNKKSNLNKLIIASSLFAIANMSYAEQFKRFSVSAGWMHGTSMGKVQTFRTTTAVAEGTRSKVGYINGQTILDNLDMNQYQGGVDNDNYQILAATIPNPDDPNEKKYYLSDYLQSEFYRKEYTDMSPEEFYASLDGVTGFADIDGLSAWNSNAGLKVKDLDTLGLMFTYNINENISLQMLGGIPPKVELKGEGQVYAPFSAYTSALQEAGGIDIYLKNNILITNLDNVGTAATARAWTPGFQAQYYFGKPGVNKFRPFIGAGFMYAYFNDIEINSQVEADLIQAGHMIQNIKDGKAGAALDRAVSSANVKVDVDANDAFAPMVSAGFTYDINSSWFATASVSYAKLDNTATITVRNGNDNSRLFQAKTKIDIDPLLTYVGVGYRF